MKYSERELAELRLLVDQAWANAHEKGASFDERSRDAGAIEDWFNRTGAAAVAREFDEYDPGLARWREDWQRKGKR